MKEILDSDYEEKFRELLEKKLEEFSHLTKYDQKKVTSLFLLQRLGDRKSFRCFKKI